MIKRGAKTSNQTGFTIVELMIATMVFSVVIFIITAGVLAFTRSYYKGLNSSTTQNTARGVMDAISQAIQFSGKVVVGTDDTKSNYFCTGDYVYMFSLGKEQSSAPSKTNWGLYRGTNTAANGCQPLLDLTSDGVELLGKQMRLSSISVQAQDASKMLWQVSLRIAFGDNDLLCTPNVADSCSSASSLSDAQLADPGVQCKSQTGSQFCAVSALSTMALQRVKPQGV